MKHLSAHGCATQPAKRQPRIEAFADYSRSNEHPRVLLPANRVNQNMFTNRAANARQPQADAIKKLGICDGSGCEAPLPQSWRHLS
jgi:hypothetical protein